MSHPILQAKELTRTYGRVVALDGANLELYPGEVLAVVGDNGAGKSTLIKCLSGAEVPESGTITLDGNDVNFKRPQDGRANEGVQAGPASLVGLELAQERGEI